MEHYYLFIPPDNSWLQYLIPSEYIENFNSIVFDEEHRYDKKKLENVKGIIKFSSALYREYDKCSGTVNMSLLYEDALYVEDVEDKEIIGLLSLENDNITTIMLKQEDN